MPNLRELYAALDALDPAETEAILEAQLAIEAALIQTLREDLNGTD